MSGFKKLSLYRKTKDGFEPVSTLQLPGPVAVLKLISCKCKKTCHKNSGYKKAGLKYTNICVNCESSCNTMPLKEIEENENDPEFPKVLEDVEELEGITAEIMELLIKRARFD